MSFWGKIFGTDKAIEGGVNMVRDGLDALVYTDEEKAGYAAKERTEARQMVVKWMESTQGQNLARRLIALSITAVWLLMYIVSLIMSLTAVWVESPQQWIASAKVIGGYSESMNGAMMLILAFYFAAPHMGDIASAALNKFSSRKG
jgi:hypothetical protein